MSAFFNLGSLILGVAAWAIPVFAVIQHRRGRRSTKLLICSFTACAIALLLQLFEIRHRVRIEDFSALMDTIGAISVASVILVAVTVAVNFVAAHLCEAQKK